MAYKNLHGASLIKQETHGWYPGDFGTSLAWWIRADRGVTKDGSNLVTQADDLSSYGRHPTASGTGRPTWNATGINGLPSFDFAGDDFLQYIGTVVSAQPFVVFIVGRNDGDGSTYRNAFDGYGAGRTLIYAAVTSKAIGAAAGSLVTSASTWTGTKQVTAVINGANSFVRVNGSQVQSGNAGAGTLAGVTLGRDPTAANWWIGSIPEVFVVTGSLTGTELVTAESYLVNRYAIA